MQLSGSPASEPTRVQTRSVMLAYPEIY
jgi:hypothetical protein